MIEGEEGFYITGEGSDNEVMFSWKPSRFEIHDDFLSRTGGEHTKGWVRMDRYDFIDFLLHSDFLAQHGYNIEKTRINQPQMGSDKDINIEIKSSG